ncbi:MAG TPA: DNA-3-methyladenine glycosylase [Candidatus Dormibacteraeota bacterium]|nr:DNA-3-methyladenine glycosylase [Candidatus Dormibacteraeota bacterium]
MRPGARLPRSFFARPTLLVARDLLGKVLTFGDKAARLVEVEAYIGDDPASHARFGLTGRNYPMFGPPGFTYVYRIYGNWDCLNLSTEPAGIGAAILVRGAEPLTGFDDGVRLTGPGLLCAAFGITTKHTNLDLTRGPIAVRDTPPLPARTIGRSHRIGVKDRRPWRFYVRGSAGVSGPASLRA